MRCTRDPSAPGSSRGLRESAGVRDDALVLELKALHRSFAQRTRAQDDKYLRADTERQLISADCYAKR